FGLRRDVRERICAVEIQIGLRERRRDRETCRRGIEARRVRARAQALDERALAAPEVQIPRETQAQVARPIRIAGERRWIDVVLGIALPGHFTRQDGARLTRAD